MKLWVKILLLFLSLATFSSNATNYYISNSSGNDSNNGSIQNPWKTINKLANYSFQSGDQILSQSSFLLSVSEWWRIISYRGVSNGCLERCMPRCAVPAASRRAEPQTQKRDDNFLLSLPPFPPSPADSLVVDR